jgi:hypothetical protein
MPELMKKPQVVDKLDLPQKEMPRDIPVGDTELTKGKPKHQSVPMAKVDTGDVPMHAPSAASNKGVSMGRMAQDLMASLPDDEEDGAPTPTPPVEQTLPAIISTALSTTPGQVKSYQMANVLAGNPNKGKLAKMMHDQFSMFSERPMGLTPKDIYSISSWTNDKYEIQAMAAWVFMHGEKIADNITTKIDAMPGYLPQATLWEDHETETRFLIVRETPEDLAGENHGDVDEMLEEEDANIAENLRGQRPREDQCLYYIYAWSEAKDKLGAEGIKRELEAIALDVAKKFPGQTVREAYEKLEWEYLQEAEEEKPEEKKEDKKKMGLYGRNKGDGGLYGKKSKGLYRGLLRRNEDTEKVNGGYENIGPHKRTATGKKRKHHKFGSKHGADQQRKAMFANGYHEAAGLFTSAERFRLNKAALLKACGIPYKLDLSEKTFLVQDPATGKTYDIFGDTKKVQFRFKSPELSDKWEQRFEKMYPNQGLRVGQVRKVATEFLGKPNLKSDIARSFAELSYEDFMKQLAADVRVVFTNNPRD